MLLEFHYKIRRHLPRCEKFSPDGGIKFCQRDRGGDREREREIFWSRFHIEIISLSGNFPLRNSIWAQHECEWVCVRVCVCVCVCVSVCPLTKLIFHNFRPSESFALRRQTDGNVIWLLAIIFGADHKPKARCSQSPNGVQMMMMMRRRRRSVSQSPVSRGVGRQLPHHNRSHEIEAYCGAQCGFRWLLWLVSVSANFWESAPRFTLAQHGVRRSHHCFCQSSVPCPSLSSPFALPVACLLLLFLSL